jgi:MFS family permease
VNEPTLASEPTRWVTRDVRWILISQLTFGFAWSLYLLTPKFLATQLHAGPDVIGRIGATGGLAGLLIVPFAGYALDRIGRRILYQLGASLVVLMSIGYLYVDAIGPLVYLLQGCTSAAFVLAYNASAALLSDYAPPAKLGQAIGWVGGANVFMHAIATMVAEPLANEHGWPAVFILGIASGSAALLISFGMRESPARPAASAVIASAPATGPRPTLFAILFTALLMGGVFVAVFGFVQPYAIREGASEVRGFFIGFTISAVGCRVLLGGLGDRLGRRVVSVWMLVGYGVSSFLMRELDPDLLVVYGLVFGAAHGILYPTLNALVLEVLPGARRGLGMVLYNGAFNVGGSVGSLGWGLLAKHHGYPRIYDVAGVLALAAATILLVGRRRASSVAAVSR